MSKRNLKTVITFEFLRAIRKKSFWVTLLAVPLLMGVAAMLLVVSNESSTATQDDQKNALLTFEYVDYSGVVNHSVASAMGGTLATDEAAAAERARRGDTQAFFIYPQHPSTDPVQITGQDVGIFENSKYEAVARSLLGTSITSSISNPEAAAINSGNPQFVAKTYREGIESGGLNMVIIPLAFVAIFYLIVLMLGNHMLNITVEEKENRVTEMMLTTMSPTTMISGKIVAVAAVGLLQILVFVTIPVVALVAFRDKMQIPGLDLKDISAEPTQVVIGILLLLGGLTLFTGCLVAAGAVMPTAKEASSIFGAVVVGLFIPFYAISLIVTDPNSLIVNIFTFFPLTAPVTAMARNGLGNLEVWQAVTVIGILFATGTLMLMFAIRLFKHGSISYSNKLNILKAFTAK